MSSLDYSVSSIPEVCKSVTMTDIILSGHWGTCPGLIFVYSHLNYLIRTMNLDMLYVVGPGHGAPAILAALWLEGSLEKFYPHYSRDEKGLHRLISTFSTTGGFPRSVHRLAIWFLG
jgi:xylulose-5-phosphate/fructose-6-phosphate phosphoketolase